MLASPDHGTYHRRREKVLADLIRGSHGTHGEFGSPIGSTILENQPKPGGNGAGASIEGAGRPRTGDEGLEVFAGITRTGTVLVSVGLMCCVAVGDYLTGSDVNFTLLYLGPIGLTAWFGSFRAATGLSVASAVLSTAADVLVRPRMLPAAVTAWNVTVQLGTFMALVLLLAALQARLAAEQQAARTDPLTTLANRRAFQEMAGLELERARRTGRPLTVAYLDIDDFKVVNDRQGHARGDALLVILASTLRGATRAVDVVGRLGGDEFGLLLVETDGPAAEALLARIRSALATAIAANGYAVTFSIGAATFLSPPRSVDEMMLPADQLMYEAKRAGKDAVRLDVLPRPAAAGNA